MLRAMRAWCVRWCTAIALLSFGVQAQAQVGIGFVDDGVSSGLVGSDKGFSYVLACPAGQLPSGMIHIDRSMDGPEPVSGELYGRGMTNNIRLYCSAVQVTAAPAVQVVVGGQSLTYNMPNNGTSERADCPAGRVLVQMGGYDRDTNGFPWSSAMTGRCAAVTLNASHWVQINTASAANLVENPVGEIETNAPHTQRGPFCSVGSYNAVAGVRPQIGGIAYDGFYVHCGQIRQARHSAVLTFNDFAWSTAGWQVDLTKSGVLLDGTSASGAGKATHASLAANNAAAFQAAQELYVLPGTGYGAAVSQAPVSVPSNSYVTSGSCVNGVTHTDRTDASCTLVVDGLPDLGVAITTPAPAYRTIGQAQNVVVTATNYGAGNTVAADGFALVVTLPAGWTPGTVAGCTVSGQTLRCPLNTTLAAAASPGAAGGTRSFTFTATTNSSVAAGSFNATAQLDRTTPDGDASPTNDDYNTSNDAASDALVFVLPTLTLAKTWVHAALGDTVTVSASGTPAPAGGSALASVADSANETDTGASPYSVRAGNTYTLSEVFGTGAAGSYSKTLVCTGNTGTGAALAYTADATSGTLTVGQGATSITCTFTNTRRPVIRLQKALPVGRSVAGDQFTLRIANGATVLQSATTTGATNAPAEVATLSPGAAGTTYTLSEVGAGSPVAVLGNYTTTYSCTNALAGGQAPSGSGTSFQVVVAAGDDLACTFTNQARTADVSVTKTASAPSVANGQSVQFTLLVSNVGPAAADGAQIRDPAVTGLDCMSVTCTSAGSASCPGSPSVATLQSPGLIIPALPAGGSVSLVLTCTVTASGF